MSGRISNFAASVLVALALVAAGCGGSDGNDASAGGDSNGGSGTIEKAVFVKEGNKICKKSLQSIYEKISAVIEKEREKPGYNAKAVETELVEDVMTPGLRKELSELHALGLPSEDEQQASEVLNVIDEVVKRTETDPAAFAGASRNIIAEATRTAHQYGLVQCPYG